MKRHLFILALVGALAAAVSACSSNPHVSRVDSGSQIDVSGRWNDTDVRTVCNSLIRDCINSERVAQFVQQYQSRNNGKLPTVIVGAFRNNGSEHIDTSIISKSMEIAIVNSGRLDFVAGGDTRSEIRAEREDQQVNASEKTASALANETGANFMLTGAVKMIEDQAGNRAVRSYFVSAELTNIETNTRLWMGENNEIKKDIKRPRARM
jgi:PBP1b-binding outer membrane lipoprotein LpoB